MVNKFLLSGWAIRALALVAIAAVVLYPFWAKHSSNPESNLSVLIIAFTSAMLTMSLNICMGYGGLMSLAHTGMLMIGGYASGILFTRYYTINSWYTLPAALVAGVIFSVLIISVSLRATYLYFGIITLAANLVVMEIARNGGDFSGGENGILGISPPYIGDNPISPMTFYYVCLAILVAVYLVQRNTILSGFGRATMSLRESSETASALGVSPSVQRVKIFAISGGIAGLAGGLLAMQSTFISPDVGDLNGGLIFFVGLFLGGIGTLVGPLAGVALIALIDFQIRFSGAYRTLILGGILLLSMMVIPRGIVGTYRASRWGEAKEHDVASEDRDENIITTSEIDPRGEVVLDVRDVKKHFGGIHAVDGVSLAVRAGEIHAIMGPNGSGKSTLVSCLTRYHSLTSGEVGLFGKPLPRTPHGVARAGVSRVFQVPHLFDRVSVIDNVLTGMRIHEKYTWLESTLRLPRYVKETRAERRQARALLALTGLQTKEELSAANISHGQKRLLEIVRAVATRPRILILDEPATGLTQPEMETLHNLIVYLAGHGIAIVLIEHNVDFLLGLADIVTVLEGGRVIAEGKPDEVRNNPVVIEAYLGRTDLIEESA